MRLSYVATPASSLSTSVTMLVARFAHCTSSRSIPPLAPAASAERRYRRKGYPRVAQAAQGLPCSSSDASPRTATSARVPASVIGPVRGPRSASTSSKRRVAGRRRPAPTRRCAVERPGFASLRCGLAIPTDYRLQGPHRSGRSPHLPTAPVPFGPAGRGRRWRSHGKTAIPTTDTAACAMRRYAPWRAWSKRPTPGPGI